MPYPGNSPKGVAKNSGCGEPHPLKRTPGAETLTAVSRFFHGTARDASCRTSRWTLTIGLPRVRRADPLAAGGNSSSTDIVAGAGHLLSKRTVRVMGCQAA